MNKAELIDAIADRTGVAKATVETVIKGMTDTVDYVIRSASGGACKPD